MRGPRGSGAPAGAPARRAAARVLVALEAREGLLDSLVEAAASAARLSGRDRAFFLRLCLEATRRKLTLDAVIGAFSGRDPAKLAPGLLAALRLGVFEVLFSRSPRPWAFTNEAVENARALAGSRAAGLCNAVMRKIVAGTERRPCRGAASPERTLRTEAEECAVFSVDVLPGGEGSCERLAVETSHPPRLVSMISGGFGAAGARRILEEDNRVPPLYARVRPGAAPPTPEPGQSFLRARYPDVVRLEGGPPLPELPSFREGLLAVQDETATAPVRSLDLAPGMLVLDACAAPGGKAVQACDAMEGRGAVVAVDIDRRRLSRLGENAARTRAVGLLPVCGDSSRPPFRPGVFDRVLVDAPCSNSGVLRRRADARYRITPESVASLAASQKRLLGACAPLAREGGLVVYSTCSILPEENQAVVEALAAESPGFVPVFEESVLPGAADGGYHAVLERRAL